MTRSTPLADGGHKILSTIYHLESSMPQPESAPAVGDTLRLKVKRVTERDYTPTGVVVEVWLEYIGHDELTTRFYTPKGEPYTDEELGRGESTRRDAFLGINLAQDAQRAREAGVIKAAEAREARIRRP